MNYSSKNILMENILMEKINKEIIIDFNNSLIFMTRWGEFELKNYYLELIQKKNLLFFRQSELKLKLELTNKLKHYDWNCLNENIEELFKNIKMTRELNIKINYLLSAYRQII